MKFVITNNVIIVLDCVRVLLYVHNIILFYAQYVCGGKGEGVMEVVFYSK